MGLTCDSCGDKVLSEDVVIYCHKCDSILDDLIEENEKLHDRIDELEDEREKP